ncbi:lysophospholipid acyltransferase family protein [Lewinella sp. IMCC34183]|uniref:lysophospholipid acyltransferase family protein n=1 Tax=Lewinella sp. IMCC34183 TaxID=2248762 RepID=UPI000E27322E|nr:lysophospholipid acyltransferase family protein [Lewinella sp. IMCC34183]
MGYLLYYLVLLPLSYLPLRALYGLGSALRLLNRHVIKYRLGVVRENLRGAFPDWSEAEVERQSRRYFSYFFDSIAESIKQFSMTEATAVRRCRVVNPEAVAHLRAQGKSYIAYGGHYANWEMAGLSFPSQLAGFGLMAIYAPLKDAVMDRLITANRGRFGVHLLPRRKVDDYYAAPPEQPMVEFFVADQSPSNAVWQKLHHTTFLGRPTAFLAGPERYAVRYDRPVYYMTLRRQARGYYTAKLVRITDDPRSTPPGFITEAFARRLEHEIRRDPAPWLWSHRRWKRPVPEEVEHRLRGAGFVPPVYDRDLRNDDSDE